jgi:hypothetical protein
MEARADARCSGRLADNDRSGLGLRDPCAVDAPPRSARQKPYYARVGMKHHWLIDLDARALTAARLESGRWLELGVYGDERDASIEPFDAITLNVASWWPLT